MENILKLKVVVSPKKTGDGREFLSYKTYSKNDRATTVKFKKSVKTLPEKTCFMIVDKDKVNLNKSGEYPVLWVEEVIEYEDIATATADARRKELDEYFGN